MDKHEFDKQIAMYHIGLAVLLTVGGALFAAGIAFLTTGATEINHAVDAQGDSQDRMYAFGFKFIGSGMMMFFVGLFIVSVSGIVFPLLVKRMPRPSQSSISKAENTQDSDQSDSVKASQQEEEIKNVNTRLEIANLKLELVNLKLELATQKLEQATSKKITDSHKKKTKDLQF